MTALEIAKQRAKENLEERKQAERAERQRRIFVQQQGDKLEQLVESVLMQFSQDFVIEKLKDKAWKMYSVNGRCSTFFITLKYDTHPWKGSDESPEEPFNQWVVNVQILDFKWGNYNTSLDTYTTKDAYFCYLESNFEQEFGEYMAKYYE